jgi:4-aminobutyrate aminotransferase-like enzyme/Ser/Thr protein kinase RdoA (MazF antagonist)
VVTRTARTDDRLDAWLADDYGLAGSLSPLGGAGTNFLLTSSTSRRFVVKLADADATPEAIALEYEAIEAAHPEVSRLGVALPRFVKTRAGAIASERVDADGSSQRLWVLEWVPGTPWLESPSPTREQLRGLGQLIATLDRALARIEHPAARRTHHWDLARAVEHRALVGHVDRRHALVDWAYQLYAAYVLPATAALPHSLIHGDANDENVLVDRGRVTGLIDFGDCLRNPTVCDLAIALTYALLEFPDPVEAGAEIVGAYHEVRHLSPDELRVIFPLVCGRLAVTIVTAASRRQVNPNHPTWFITEDRAWRLLEKLSAIDPDAAAVKLASQTGIDVRTDTGRAVPELLADRREHLSPALSISYRQPIKMVRGVGQFLIDHRGRPFLDLVNNVCHVGHCHPRVVAVAQQQMARLNTNTRYLYDGLTEYATRLAATLPAPLDTCFFVNSGTEANELALRLAMAHTKRRQLLVVDGAYHGHTATLIAASPYKFMGRGGSGRPEGWVHVVPLPDGYRGPHKGRGRAAGEAYAADLARVIAQAGEPVAAFLTESFQSCGGQIIPPEGYLEQAFRHVRAAGGVCIADEVQTGFGRAGTHFWAFETQDVVPDIVVMGKPIGNGHPMGAVVTSREIAASFANGMEFFSTFGGNPVSCAIGLAVLDVIRDEGLQQRALELGARFRDGLLAVKEKHALVGDVRGAGLFLGVELVRDRTTREPAAEEATDLIDRMAARGILLATDGPFHNVLKIKPPMVLTADDVDAVVRALDDELVGLASAH